MKKGSVVFSLTLLFGVMMALVVVNNQLLSRFRVDLTENEVYSLSPGSEAVIRALDEPVTLYFFFSEQSTSGMTALRNYAERVKSLLKEYQQVSNGKLILKVVDPEPFSEAEDQANSFGLTGAAIGNLGEAVYFGLAATNRLDDQLVIPFFDPQKEQFLEYDISKLIYQLSDPEPVSVALVTDLGVSGSQNPMTGQYSGPMVFYQQLSQLYDVSLVKSDATQLPDDIDIVVLAHATNLNDRLAYAIDQFAMTKGRVVVFADAHFESDPMAMMGPAMPNRSDDSLLRKWGIELAADSLVIDAQLGLDIRGRDGGVVRHPGILGVTAEQMDEKDVVTANLDSINLASVGSLALVQDSPLTMLPLIRSSANAQQLDATVYTSSDDPKTLARQLTAANESFVLAARFSGKASSAFEAAPEGSSIPYTSETDALNVIVVADADLLTDRFWVQQSNFFGQTIATPFANNGDFVVNAVENLAGSDALISIRSRGTFTRPFTRVKALEVAAQARFRQQEQRLQQQLEETEAQLAQLQSTSSGGTASVLNPEQQAAIESFLEQRVNIRKSLRDVRYQLEKDIEQLGNWLKFLSIVVAPAVLVFFLWMAARLLRRRAS